jgi:hypothetical protein
MYLSCKNSLPLHILSPHLAFNSLITKYGSLGWMLNAYKGVGPEWSPKYSPVVAAGKSLSWNMKNPHRFAHRVICNVNLRKVYDVGKLDG